MALVLALPHVVEVMTRSRAVEAAWRGLRWAAAHSGLPLILVTAIAMVVTWRLAKKVAHVFVELAVALALLLLATKLGWIDW